MIYPNDANGDALRRMEAQGDDLTRPRDIDFSVAFADAGSAEQFAQHFRALGHEVSVELTETNQDFPWDVVVVQHMVPSYDGITSFENLLQSVADGWGGHNDGWGCFSERPSINLAARLGFLAAPSRFGRAAFPVTGKPGTSLWTIPAVPPLTL